MLSSGQVGGEDQINHVGPERLSRIMAPAMARAIANLVYSVIVWGLACNLGLTSPNNQVFRITVKHTRSL